ncbi:MAG: cell wall-binding repeat-containing protein [Acidimicrobiales bacterium]
MPSTITPTQFIRRARDALGAAVLVLAALVVLPAPASSTPTTTSAETGYDISFPQCGGSFPSGQGLAIVGVNDGVPDSLNPCLGTSPSYPSISESELYWAVSTSSGPAPNASLYVNTADPGDVYDGSAVTNWPTSGTAPDGYGDCTTTTITTNSGPATAGANSTACAWLYGAEAGNDDLSWLQSAGSSVNVSTAASSYPWWLDVETGNSWQQGATGLAMNVAVLQGMQAALAAGGATSIGVYSTSRQWGIITGGTSAGTPAIGGLPTWIPGAGTLSGAEAACSDGSFTTGPVTLTQWTTNIDGDVLCSSAVTSTSPTPVPTQIYGSDAIGTSIAISQTEFPTAGSARAVVLARSDFFSDALAGGPLAAKLGGPLLITPGASTNSTVDPRVLTEIQRVLPVGDPVYILGGDLAISPGVDSQLESLGYSAVREAGVDEYATAVDIAQALGNPSTIFLATGLNFYDALSSVPAAIEKGAAILLTNGSAQAPETGVYLGQHSSDTVYAIGGPEAAYGADPSATPVYGQTLYDTSAAVATTFFPGAAVYGAATSADFPDALGGGVCVATGSRLGPILLVDPSSATLWPSVASYLSTLAVTTPGFVFGGPLAVPGNILSALQAAVG